MAEYFYITVKSGSIASVLFGFVVGSIAKSNFCGEAKSCQVCVRDLECYWCPDSLKCNVYQLNSSTAYFCPGQKYRWKTCTDDEQLTIIISVCVVTFVLVAIGIGALCFFRKYKMRKEVGFIGFRKDGQIGWRRAAKRLREQRHWKLQAEKATNLKKKYGLEEETMELLRE